MQNAAQLLELLRDDPVWLEEHSRPMSLARHSGGAMRDERLLAMFADDEAAGGREAGGPGCGVRGGGGRVAWVMRAAQAKRQP